jgi:hypothetical protein
MGISFKRKEKGERRISLNKRGENMKRRIENMDFNESGENG